ncbi:hypothetical protein ScPMuIL_001050 [Solemya velum]
MQGSYSVIKVVPRSVEDVRFLQGLLQEHTFKGIDVWKPPSRVDSPVAVSVAPEILPVLRGLLTERGLEPKITIPDVQKEIDKQTIHRILQLTDGVTFDYSQYHKLDEINAWTKNITSVYSSLASMFQITTSYEGRPVYAIKISSTNSSASKPIFFFDGGIHAREWISPATMMYMTNQLLEQYGKDVQVTRMVNEFDWYIVPVFNVDGYDYTWTNDRMWRKTRTKHGICRGVDPNRNWDFEWCKQGASKDPCSDTYCGPSPFSEPVVKGVADFIKGLGSDVKAYIDFHSYSEVWMSPWGYTRDLPKDFDMQDKGSIQAVDALKSVYGTTYDHGSIANVLYTASGSSVDWTYGVLGIKYSYAVELRDKGEFGFLLPADQIIPTGQETFKALVALAEFVFNNP